MFKLARAREKKTRDLRNIRCTKGEDGKALVEETKIRERWRGYFYRLFNGDNEYSLHLVQGVQERDPNDRACSHISKEEVKDTLRRTKSGKAVGPDHIPMEI